MNKYQNSYYWQHLIQTQQLPDIFNNMPITEQSLFFHGIIHNAFGQRTLIEEIVHFPSPEICIGYLQHIYLPMAFFSFTNQENGIFLPIDFNLDELIYYISNDENVQHYRYLTTMKEIAHLIKMLAQRTWEKEIFLQILAKIELLMLEHFHQDSQAYAYFHLYQTPVDLAEAINQIYLISDNFTLGEKIFRYRTGLTKKEWVDLYHQASSNIFASRKFMNTLQYLRHN